MKIFDGKIKKDNYHRQNKKKLLAYIYYFLIILSLIYLTAKQNGAYFIELGLKTWFFSCNN